MVVKQRCHTVLNAFDIRRVRRQLTIFQRQTAVERPPKIFQNLREIARRLRYAHAARVGAVDVRMRIDHARHDNATADVKDFVIGETRF